MAWASVMKRAQASPRTFARHCIGTLRPPPLAAKMQSQLSLVCALGRSKLQKTRPHQVNPGAAVSTTLPWGFGRAARGGGLRPRGRKPADVSPISTADWNWTKLASKVLKQGEEDHEEVEIFRRADHLRIAAGRFRDAGGRCVPAARGEQRRASTTGARRTESWA